MILKSEGDVKRFIVKEFKARGHYARRIEDQFSVGFPDLVLVMKGDYPVTFAEAKMIRGAKFGPTDRQYVEMTRLAISKHSVPILIGYLDGCFYLHPHAKEAQLINCTTQMADENIVQLIQRFHNERST